MFCKNCGAQIDDRAVICPKCGAATDNFRQASAPQADDAPSAGFAVLCFFFPVVGLILYLVWKDSMPMRARSGGKGALISVIVEAAACVFVIIFVFAAGGFAACVAGSYVALL